MFDFSDEQKMMRKALRRWVEAGLVPHVDALESEAMLPYEPMRNFIKTFGADEMARSTLARLEKRAAAGEASPPAGSPASPASDDDDGPAGLAARDPALSAIISIEFSRVSPGFCMAFGASLGLCGGAIMRRGTLAQKKRFALPVLTGEKIGAWAITEPGAGSDAFGGMTTVARRVDGGYVLRGQKTFISNAPHADVMVVYAKMEHGELPMRKRPIHAFVLERGMKGLTLGKPMKKMGMWSSPTGEIFLDEVFVPADQLLGEKEKEPSREGARDVFNGERTGMVPMCFGIIERCLEESLRYAKERKTWDTTIGEYQLVQAKLARMFGHYQNVRNLLFKSLWMQKNNVAMTMGEASSMKAYCAPVTTEVAMEAVQIMGGNGYMRECRVEQLARDAKLLQIGGGTDEIQLVTCARALLAGDMPGLG
jgi:alkylation response protein AidB-like acyl-CoA dehydrogenase